MEDGTSAKGVGFVLVRWVLSWGWVGKSESLLSEGILSGPGPSPAMSLAYAGPDS